MLIRVTEGIVATDNNISVLSSKAVRYIPVTHCNKTVSEECNITVGESITRTESIIKAAVNCNLVTVAKTVTSLGGKSQGCACLNNPLCVLGAISITVVVNHREGIVTLEGNLTVKHCIATYIGVGNYGTVCQIELAATVTIKVRHVCDVQGTITGNSHKIIKVDIGALNSKGYILKLNSLGKYRFCENSDSITRLCSLKRCIKSFVANIADLGNNLNKICKIAIFVNAFIILENRCCYAGIICKRVFHTISVIVLGNVDLRSIGYRAIYVNPCILTENVFLNGYVGKEGIYVNSSVIIIVGVG